MKNHNLSNGSLDKMQKDGILKKNTKPIPGLLLAMIIALIALYLGKLNNILNDVIIAILIGALIRNFTGVPETAKEGLTLCLKMVLRIAIILLGTQLSFQQILKTGGDSLFLIFFVVSATIPVIYYLGRKLGLGSEMCALLGVGSSICGASAILATGPAIKAKERDIALAVATIFIFNSFALFVYPLIGQIVHMSDLTYGTWVGLAVQDVSSVVATGFAYSQNAGEIATVVKLTRTVFIVPVVFFLALLFSWKKRRSIGEFGYGTRVNYIKIFPWFVLGFLLMALLNTFGVFSTKLVGTINPIIHFLILMVMVSIGTGLDFRDMKKVGLSFLYSGLTGMLIMSLLSIFLIYLLGIGTNLRV